MQGNRSASHGVSLDGFVAEVINTPGLGGVFRLCDVAEMESVCSRVPEAFSAAAAGDLGAYGLHQGLMQHLHEPVFRYAQFLEEDQERQHREREAKLLRSLKRQDAKDRKRWGDLERDGREAAGVLARAAVDERTKAELLQRVEAGQRAAGWLDAMKRAGPREPVSLPRGGMRQEMAPTLEFLACIEDVCAWIECGPWSEADGEACAVKLEAAWCKWIAYLSSYWMWAKVPRLLGQKNLSKRNGRQPAKDGKPGRPGNEARKAEIVKRFFELEPSKGRGTAGAVAAAFGVTYQYVNKLVRQAKKGETNPAG